MQSTICPVEHDQLAGLHAMFKRDRADLASGGGELAMAFGYIIGYPMFAQAIGPAQESGRAMAWQTLEAAHVLAVRRVIREAEAVGIDGGPLVEYGRICRELFRADPTRYAAADYWPECLGNRADLSAYQAAAVRDGHVTLERINARLGLQDDPIRETVHRKHKGRPAGTDAAADTRIATAWATGEYKNREELARAFKMTVAQAVRALDRHRHRVKRAEK